MGIEDVWASVQNIFPCKYISPTGIEIVSDAQIILAGKNLPTGYKYKNICGRAW